MSTSSRPGGSVPMPDVIDLGNGLLFMGAGILEVQAAFNSRVREVKRNGATPSPRVEWIQLKSALAAQRILDQAKPMSHPRQRDATSNAAQQHSTSPAQIGSREAAHLLGVTTRQVQRLAASLEGHRLANGHYIFDRSTVQAYALAVHNNRRPAA